MKLDAHINKLQMYQDTIDDLVREKKNLSQEKQELMAKYVKFKEFHPLYEAIEKQHQSMQAKYINSMK